MKITKYNVKNGPEDESFTKTSADLRVAMRKSSKATIAAEDFGVKQSPFKDAFQVIDFSQFM